MREFDNPNAHLKFRVPPYTKLKGEERAYVIQNLYRQGYLKNRDVQDYLRAAMVQPLAWVGTLILSGLFASAAGRKSMLHYPIPNIQARIASSVLTFGATYTLLSFINPVEKYYQREQKLLMDYIDVNVGDYVFDYNAMLPYRWTQAQINLTTYFLMMRRRWFTPGFLIAPPVTSDLILDMSEAKVPE